MSNLLRAMVCTRCWAGWETVPDSNPSAEPAAQMLATVHTDNRPPHDNPGEIYVTLHKRDCTMLNRVLNEGH